MLIMITDLETKVLETFRKLSLKKQQEVVNLLEIIQQESEVDISENDLQIATKIINKAKKIALETPPKSPQDLWDKFTEIKDKIATEYEEKN
jgi:hypothetical protein